MKVRCDLEWSKQCADRLVWDPHWSAHVSCNAHFIVVELCVEAKVDRVLGLPRVKVVDQPRVIRDFLSGGIPDMKSEPKSIHTTNRKQRKTGF